MVFCISRSMFVRIFILIYAQVSPRSRGPTPRWMVTRHHAIKFDQRLNIQSWPGELCGTGMPRFRDEGHPATQGDIYGSLRPRWGRLSNDERTPIRVPRADNEPQGWRLIEP